MWHVYLDPSVMLMTKGLKLCMNTNLWAIIFFPPSNFSPCLLISFLISSWHVPDIGYSFGSLFNVMFPIILFHIQVIQLRARLI